MGRVQSTVESVDQFSGSPASKFTRSPASRGVVEYRKCLALLGLFLNHVAMAESLPLQNVLEALAQKNQFTVEGLEQVAMDAWVEMPDTGTEATLKELLRDYDHVMILRETGKIDRIVISRRKVLLKHQAVPTVPLLKVGAHHQVAAILTGPTGAQISAFLIVDTGASTVVLPLSLASALGFDTESLVKGSAQTAGGTVNMRVGSLSEVRLGDISARDVKVSFIADGRLGDTGLLGMSLLERYRFTIDDERQELILLAK